MNPFMLDPGMLKWVVRDRYGDYLDEMERYHQLYKGRLPARSSRGALLGFLGEGLIRVGQWLKGERAEVPSGLEPPLSDLYPLDAASTNGRGGVLCKCPGG